MPAIRVRPAVDFDAPALRDVYRRASLSNEQDRELLTSHPELLIWAADAIGEGRTRVAVIEGRAVGFATWSIAGTTVEVEDLFVDPDWMRRGVGRALVDDMAEIARAARQPSLEVDANPHALTFYERVGFVARGEVAVEYGTGIRMRRGTSPDGSTSPPTSGMADGRPLRPPAA